MSENDAMRIYLMVIHKFLIYFYLKAFKKHEYGLYYSPELETPMEDAHFDNRVWKNALKLLWLTPYSLVIVDAPLDTLHVY